MKQMRKTLSLILALVLVFSLAAVPAFAADAEVESSTSDTAYGQLHNGLLSEILSQIALRTTITLSTASSATSRPVRSARIRRPPWSISSLRLERSS